MIRKGIIVRVFGPSLFTAALVLAQSGAGQPGNTKVNKGDGGKNSAAAAQQEINATDQHLTQNIRKALMADKSLSTDAQNVKIISQGGRVTLKGGVRSEDEKEKIFAKAIELAGGDGNVDNELSVKLATTKK